MQGGATATFLVLGGVGISLLTRRVSNNKRCTRNPRNSQKRLIKTRRVLISDWNLLQLNLAHIFPMLL